MINTAEVMLWGTRIGIIHLSDNKKYTSFEYDREFLPSGIELSPFHMPLSGRIYEFPNLVGKTFHGAPGLVADSLPDTFGNKIIERWLTEQKRNPDDFNVIDRLCYTGKRGMGALEYIPAYEFNSDIIENVNIGKMVEFASDILAERKKETFDCLNNIGYSQMVRLGTSAGGARAKALIAWNEKTNEVKSGQIDAGNGFDYWLMKFGGVEKNGDHNLEDSIDYNLIEYAYYLMAKDCKIEMSECRIYENEGNNHFMTKRFDRDGNQKFHMQSLGALTHTDYNIPGLCSYEQTAFYMKELNLYQSEVEQLFRRMVFNVIFVNHDDHVKKISFMMNRLGEWKLAPAYDITFSYNTENLWLKEHQMPVHGKSKEITRADLVASGKQMGISTRRCNHIIMEIEEIAKNMKDYFDKVNLKEETCDMIINVCQGMWGYEPK